MLNCAKLVAVLGASIFCSAILAADSPPTAEQSEIKGQLEKILNTYQQRLASKDIDGILELYSAEPVFMPEYAPPAVGREALRKSYEWIFATLNLHGRFIVHEAEAVGDTAWVRTNSTGRFGIIATGVEGDVA